MLSYFKSRLFAKLGLLFFIASVCVVISSYYISIYWVNLQKDDIIDAHEAYFQYKLIESWGKNPDTLLIANELENLHLKAMVFYMDEDLVCENDTSLFWTNLNPVLSSCDYYSYLDTDMLGKKYNINYEQWVSFGEISIENKLLQTTYLEYPPFKYFLISTAVEPWRVFTFFPLFVFVLLLMGLLFFAVRRFLYPINLIEKRIVDLEKGDLSSTIKIIGEDELAVLSKNFNKLVLDIKDLLRQKERLLSDVSHELRTPLAKMRLSLALLPKHDKIKHIDKQIHAIDSMITNILLSDKMASAYSNLKLESISGEKIINKALELTFVKNIKMDVKNSFNLNVDVVKVSIAVKNLIENAFKYSGENKDIQVVLNTVKNKNVISILDRGPGIPEDQIDKIKKAFVRLPGTKNSGFGLGLSICNKVMVAHGGGFVIKNNTNGGACFSLMFNK